MATKRPAPESSGAPPAKRSTLVLAPLDIGPAAGEEDLDIKVLKVQNSKLSQRLREKNHQHDRLEEKIRELEENKDACAGIVSSLKHHFGVLRDHLLVILAQQNIDDDDISKVTNQLGDTSLAQLDQPDTLGGVFETVNQCLLWIQPTGSGHGKGRSDIRGSDEEVESDSESEEGDTEHKGSDREKKKAVLVLEELQKRWRGSSAEGHLLGDKVTVMEAKCEQLEEKLADARFDLQKSQSRSDHLEVRLADALEELQKRPTLSSSSPNETSSSTPSGDKGQESLGGVAEGGASNSGKDDKVTTDEMDQLQVDLTEYQTIAESRLKEIKELSLEIQELKKKVTQLQLDQNKLPDSAIADSAPYKTLQTQFSISVQEAGQLRACLDEARQLLVTAKQQHIMQLEEIRGEENKYQLEVREEMVQLETALLATKRDYELLRIEFERTVVSNEQAAPIAKELQVTVDSLQKTIQQLKAEVTRYKTRAHKAEQQLMKTQEDKEKTGDVVKQTSSTSSEPSSTAGVASEKTTPIQPQGDDSSEDKLQQVAKGEGQVGGASSEEINKLKEEVAKLEERNLSLESDLETLRQATGKEEREKADILTAEKKARAQIEELKKKFEDYRKDYERRKDHIREESGRKVKSLMEDNKHLQKELSAKRHEAQALMAEMESTAQAFEEMQEQNIRLLQQLKEKDDANFKLMSERIKSNSIQKLLLEEKDLLHSQLVAINTEKQRLAELIGQLEERERNSEVTIQTMDKELTLKQQAIEMHKHKALESVQSIQEWQGKVNDLEGRVANAESALQGKVEECEKESLSAKRSQEEIGALKRKLEKYKSREWMASSDEVLLEEIKTYKAKLNCPCCSTRKKDTVLTKCFHVFCSECIRSRYDSRLRKCPKCGAAFGANDFHKIYLS